MGTCFRPSANARAPAGPMSLLLPPACRADVEAVSYDVGSDPG